MDNRKNEFLMILSHSQLFNGMAASSLDELYTKSNVVEIQKSGIPLEELGKVSGLYVVLDGHVEVVKGGQTRVAQLGRGSFFGEISLFSLSFGATASVVSPNGSTCLLIPKAELRAWFERHPKNELLFYKHLSTELCQRLYSTTSKLSS